MVDLTDPATEIAAVIAVLREYPATNDPTWQIFKKAIGPGISSHDYWHLISALRFRLEKLERLVRATDDVEFRHKDQGQRLLRAIDQFKGAFEPAQHGVAWQATLQQNIRADDGLQIAQFSYVARRLWPLRAISEEDRKALIKQINSVLADIESENEFPSWAKAPLVDGLVRLQLALMHLIFIGHDSAIEQLQNLYQRTIVLEDAINAERKGQPIKSIRQTLEIIALVGALFCLPDQAITAFERYQGIYLIAIINSPRMPKPEQRLLPKPVAVDAQPVFRRGKRLLIREWLIENITYLGIAQTFRCCIKALFETILILARVRSRQGTWRSRGPAPRFVVCDSKPAIEA